ncbi:MAG: hypothetical protein CFE21_07565 [Bacteroidetes bacterium B1(2017)]|nr:MAG: hypothetical protein CFE21_07565 [Bacteroidetes bacterium B1(2017)]
MKKSTLLSLLFLFVLNLLSAQQVAWVNKIGSTQYEQSKSIVTDYLGNVYSVGSFMDTVDFDPGVGIVNLIVPVGKSSAFIRKLDKFGNLKWIKSFPAGTWANEITTDKFGNVYILGDFQGTIDFDPGIGVTNLSGGQMYVCKLDSAGIFVFVKAIASAGGVVNGTSIKVDDNQNIYTIGNFNNTTDFDPGSSTFNLTSVAGNVDIFISKLNSLGNFVWAKKIGDINYDKANSLYLDKLGNIYATGFFQGTIDFDPGPTTVNITASGSDGFLLKLNALGNFVWAKKVGGAGADDVTGIVTDDLCNIYYTGYFAQTVDMDLGSGTFNLVSLGNDDIFISKLDSSGNFVWAKKLGGTGGERVYSLAIDSAKNIYTTGFTSGGDFDPGVAVFTINNSGAFLSKLNNNGDFVWAKGLGGLNIISYSMCLGPNGFVYSTGSFSNGATDFDPGKGTLFLEPKGSDDVYVHATCNFVIIPGTSSTICEGQRLNLTVNNIPGAGYQWSGPNGFSSNSQNPSIPVISSLGGGIYTVTVNQGSCIASETINITVKPAPNVNITGKDSICQGKTLVLSTVNAGSGSLYSWKGPNNYTSTTSSPVVAVPNMTLALNGFFSVLVTSFDGCQNSDSLSVVVNPLPIITITASDNSVCQGSSFILTAAGADSINWTGGIFNGEPFMATSTKTYIATGIDNKGCAASASKEILVNELPVVSVSGSTNSKCSGSCNGLATVTIISGSTPFSYLWGPKANNQITQTATSLCQGKHIVKITDINGCKTQDTAIVSVETIVDPQIYLTNLAAVDQVNISPSFAAYYTYNLPAKINVNPSNPRNFVDPGKSARFKVECTNNKVNGQSIVSGICKVRSNNPYITITDSSSALNNIGWNDKAWSADEFEINIDPNTPAGTNVYIDFIVQESGQEYSTACVSIPISPLAYSPTTAFTIDDDNNPDSRGNDNDLCEQGEIIEFYPWLDNISTMDAEYVRGRLENLDNHNYINIWNGVIGINTTVYDAGWWNYSFAKPSTINSNSLNTTPEYDFVFNYNNANIINNFKLYMVMAGGFKLFTGNALSLVQWSLPYTFKAAGASSIGNELKADNGIHVYPVPSNGILFFETLDSKFGELYIYDTIGRKVFTKSIYQKQTELDLNSLSNGVYYLSFKGNNDTAVKTIILNK